MPAGESESRSDISLLLIDDEEDFVHVLGNRLARRGIDVTKAYSGAEAIQALRGADASITAGTYSKSNREFTVSSDAFIAIAGEVERLVGGCTREGRSILKTSPQL